MNSFLTIKDRYMYDLIVEQEKKQNREITLIASENYVSQEILFAMGSVLTNKYAEGYPQKRYYAGCQIVDVIEQCAIDRLKGLFSVDHANVQPHAGSSANMAAYAALIAPGDTILGMGLMAGGHLTHGHTVNFSGALYKSYAYQVNPETERLDMDEIRAIAIQTKPKLIVAGASAYSQMIDFAAFGSIAQEVGAFLVADIAHIAGLIATGLHPSPASYADIITSTTHKTLRGPRGGIIMSKQHHAVKVDRAVFPGLQGGPCMHTIAAKAMAFYEAAQPDFITYQKQVIRNAKTMANAFAERGYRIVSGGTENHLFVLDLRPIGLKGNEAQKRLENAGIMVSKSGIPFDPEKPTVTSGIRIGTPAITTRGFTEHDCLVLVDLIDAVLQERSHDTMVKKQLQLILNKYPAMGISIG